MAIRSKGDAERMRALARRLYISNDTIDWFLSSSNAAQLRAVSELIEHEMAVREESKRARLFRRAGTTSRRWPFPTATAWTT